MSAPPPPPAAIPGIAELRSPPNLLVPRLLFSGSFGIGPSSPMTDPTVHAIFLTETAQTILSGVDLYYRFASGFGSIQHLTDPYLSTFVGPIIGAVVSVTVQYFFAYRVWVLSNKKSWWLCLFICIFSTVEATAAFTGGVYVGPVLFTLFLSSGSQKQTHVHQRFIWGRTLKVLVYTWLIGNAVADVLITAAMLYYLTIRPDRAVAYSNHALSKIVRLTIETNVLTTTTGLVSLLLLSIFPNKIWYTCPTAILGKLYSNTLLVSLNNRISIREGPTARETLPTSQSTTDRSSRIHSGIMHVDIENFPNAFKGSTESSRDEGREKILDIPGIGFSIPSEDVTIITTTA
ncbi:hypothetical protein F5148DRAFT_1150096 [Russula earlei]|uniref:Uncharacterized protein n=1 Tax=Russula earlei TaxID=71964 RepID=A0ACC0U6L0_9AGAM|nr:hypothetical protein F5148DRAFT_1150096 [Russula earlei]